MLSRGINGIFRRTTSSPLLPYQCKKCRFCFVDQGTMLSHRCQNDYVSHDCPYCSTVLTALDQSELTHVLIKHVKTEHYANYFDFRLQRWRFLMNFWMFFHQMHKLEKYKKNDKFRKLFNYNMPIIILQFPSLPIWLLAKVNLPSLTVHQVSLRLN